MKIVVVFESRTGNTERAARLIGGELVSKGHDVAVFPTDGVDLHTLSEADLAIVGTWTDGLILLGHRPGGAGNIAKHLPTMWDKPTYAFVTYAVRPGQVLRGFNKLLASKGANVLGALELHRRHLETDAPDFADAVLAAYDANGAGTRKVTGAATA
ncbi:MAG: flavodoxin domain-containing protein [Acidimicrobiales bacterium]